MNCYVCNQLLTDENKTEEHILLNSIGGRLKSNLIICKQCNSDFGEDIDSELSKQLNFIANMLNIKRERGEPQRVSGISSNGEEIWMEPGGKPSMKKPIVKLDDEGKKLTVVAPRMKGLQKLLQGLKRKYPTIDLEEQLGQARVIREYLAETYQFNLSFGGEKAFRSICKTAVNFYMYHGGNRENISHLIEYIKNGSNVKRNIVAFYYPEQQQEVIPKNNGEVFHSIILKGNSSNKLLYCYVELFNFYQILVVLNDDYNGADIEELYIYDVVQTTKKSMEHVNLSDDMNELTRVIKKADVPLHSLQKEFNKLMKIIYEKQQSEHINTMVEIALEASLKKYPEGITITPEMIEEAVEALMKEITPWLIYQSTNR